MKKFTLLVSSIFFLNFAYAEKVEYGAMVALKSFQCFQYANYAKNQSEENRQRLFTYGLSRSREFLEHAKKNPDKAKAMFDKAPWIFGALSSGPTNDFIVGRWFEWSTNDAYEKIVKNIDQEKYKHDEEFQALAARKLFFDSSCDTLGR